MSSNFKFSLGVDVSKDTLDCLVSSVEESGIKVKGSRRFKNTLKGFESLLKWLNKKTKNSSSVHLVMEATGIYHENLAHYLYAESEMKITILLPLRGKYYFKSLNVKTKTDKIDSKVLSQYGLERRSDEWAPMTKHIRSIKQLSREYRDLKKRLNVVKNRLHAKRHAYQTNPLVISMIVDQIDLIESQCKILELEMEDLVKEDETLNAKIKKLATIPGVGIMTVITIVGETNGFELITSGRQLSSYAGLDVQHNDSGQKVGKSKISKKGNRYIRQAMYMPALSAKKYIPEMNAFYKRINEKNKSKKVGLVAVGRKLLVLLYTLWKQDEEYIENYEATKRTSGYHEEEVSSL